MLPCPTCDPVANSVWLRHSVKSSGVWDWWNWRRETELSKRNCEIPCSLEPQKKGKMPETHCFHGSCATSIIPSLGQTLFCQASSLNSAKIHRSRNLREQKDMIPKQTCLLFTWVKDIFLPLLICHGRWQNKTAKMSLLSGKLKHCQTNFGCSFLKGASSSQRDGSWGQTVAFAFHSTTLISTLLNTDLEIDGW